MHVSIVVGTHISLNYALVARVPVVPGACGGFRTTLGTVFLDKGGISAGGDLILYTAELRAPFPYFTVF